MAWRFGGRAVLSVVVRAPTVKQGSLKSDRCWCETGSRVSGRFLTGAALILFSELQHRSGHPGAKLFVADALGFAFCLLATGNCDDLVKDLLADFFD